MPVVKSSERARQFVPEPVTVNIDPARTDAVVIPLTMPEVTIVAEPPVAIIRSSDDEIPAAHGPVDADVSIDAHVPVHGNVPVDVDSPIDVNGFAAALRLRIRRRRDRDSEPKCGKDGKNEGKFLQHFSASSKMLGRYLFPKPAARLRAACVWQQALGLALSKE
jgi:hypothetical protein